MEHAGRLIKKHRKAFKKALLTQEANPVGVPSSRKARQSLELNRRRMRKPKLNFYGRVVRVIGGRSTASRDLHRHH